MAFRQYKPEEWTEEINRGLDFRRKFGIEGTWGEIESLYYNVHPSMMNDGPNVIMSTGDSLLSSLVVPSPKILVKPEREEAVSKAPLLESLDNILLRELSLVDEADTAVLHAFLFGAGVWKIGYDSEFGYDPTLDVGGQLQFGMTLSQLDKKGKRRIEHDSGVTPGMPWVRAVPPHDIIVPWGTLRLTNCPWIAHRFVRQIDDLKADPKYENTGRLSPNISQEDFVNSYRSVIRLNSTWPSSSFARTARPRRNAKIGGSREPDYIELYEIHDRRTGRIMVVAPDHPSFLRNDINALQIENRLPFVGISFTPKSRSFWTTSDAYYLRQQQMELSDLAVQRTKIRRLAVLKFLYDGDALSNEELEKLLSPDVGAAARVEGGSDLSKAITTLSTHPDQALIMEEEHLRRNVREQVGFSRNQLGEFAGGRRTAFEAKVVDRSSARRMSRRMLAVRKLYQEAFEIINSIIFEHWRTPRIIQVLGEQKAQEWEQITGPQLKSRYSYAVSFTDDEELQGRKHEALQLYMLLSQDPSVNPIALRQYLSDEYNDVEIGRLFNPDVQNAMRALRLTGAASQGGQGGQGGPNGQQRQLGGGGGGTPNLHNLMNQMGGG